MKSGMKLARFALPLTALAYLPLACSSDTGPDKTIPGPPNLTGATGGKGGSSTTAGSAGMTTGGTEATGGSAGSGGASGGSGGGPANNGMSCMKTADCMGSGFFCKKAAGAAADATGLCSCSVDKPEICGTGAEGACVNRSTDPNNCGECGMKCDAGAACVAGKCGAKPTDVVTATGCGGKVRMTLADGKIYFTEETTGKVRSVAVAGGAITDLATAQAGPGHLAVDATNIYWANEASVDANKVMKKALAGNGAAAALDTEAMPAQKILALALADNKLYYALESDIHQMSTTGTGDIIVATSVNYDKPLEPVVQGIPRGMTLNATHVTFTTPMGRNAVESHTIAGPRPALVGDTGYFKLAKSIGALLESGDIYSTATHAFWVDNEKIARNKVDAMEAVPETVASAPDSKPIVAFTITDKDVYAAMEDGRIFKHSLTPPAMPDADPNPPALIARDQMGVVSMVVDATKLYWIGSDCVIRSTAL